MLFPTHRPLLALLRSSCPQLLPNQSHGQVLVCPCVFLAGTTLPAPSCTPSPAVTPRQGMTPSTAVSIEPGQLSVCLSFLPFFHTVSHPSIHSSFHPSFFLSFFPSSHPCFHPSIHPSIYPPILLSLPPAPSGSLNFRTCPSVSSQPSIATSLLPPSPLPQLSLTISPAMLLSGPSAARSCE